MPLGHARRRAAVATWAAVAVAATVALGRGALAWAQPLTAPDQGWRRPLDVSLDGRRSDTLFYLTTVMVAVLFAMVCAVLAWSLVRYRAGKHAAVYEHGIGRRHLVLTFVIAVAVFAAVDGTLLFDSYLDLQGAFWRFPTAAEHPLAVEIWAQQWSWNVRYAGPDGRFGTADDVVLLDELRVPVDRPVVIKLRAKDVIHSFYLPNFRIKMDAIPGSETRLWFAARREGSFQFGCAQHCGASHYKMHGVLTAMPAAAWERWLDDASATAARAWDERDRAAHWGWDWDSVP